MAREKATYRDTLEQLNIAFPDKQALTREEVAQYLGCGHTTIYTHYRHLFKHGRVTKANLARELAI